MTTLTLEEQKKLRMIVSPELTDENVFVPNQWNHLIGRSQALAVLDAYAKSVPEYSDNQPWRDHVNAYSARRYAQQLIFEALRTGDLDPIARELIQ